MKIKYQNEEEVFYSPEYISSLVLEKLKENYEETQQRKLHKVVISVPAYFNAPSIKATKIAGKLAGLKVMETIIEPTAAAIAYAHTGEFKEMTTVLVFDLGGGTLDVTILTCKDMFFNVRATGGDLHLGGIDFEKNLENLIINKLEGINYDRRTFNNNINKEKVKMKEDLSDTKCISVEFEYYDNDSENDNYINITIEEFEKQNEELIDRSINIVNEVLYNAELSAEDIEHVVLAGGSSRMKWVKRELEKIFPNKIHSNINPDEVVAMGAAIYADSLINKKKKVVKSDVIPQAVGIAVWNNQTSKADKFEKLIYANTNIPCSGTDTFLTLRPGQQSASIEIFQGNGQNTTDDDVVKIGEFEFEGWPKQDSQTKLNIKISINKDFSVNVLAECIDFPEVSEHIKCHFALKSIDQSKETIILCKNVSSLLKINKFLEKLNNKKIDIDNNLMDRVIELNKPRMKNTNPEIENEIQIQIQKESEEVLVSLISLHYWEVEIGLNS